ncbi:MAG: hypothetical protein ACTSR2_02135 [Candidatus Hodarchaeales archaeon]
MTKLRGKTINILGWWNIWKVRHDPNFDIDIPIEHVGRFHIPSPYEDLNPEKELSFL